MNTTIKTEATSFGIVNTSDVNKDISNVLQDKYDNSNLMKGKDLLLESTNSGCYGTNRDNLIMKQEEIESLTMNSDCTLPENFTIKNEDITDLPTVYNHNNFDGMNSVSLIIKKEEIEDPLIIRESDILNNTNSYNLDIKSEKIKDAPTICNDNILEDINSDNLTVKTEEFEVVPVICNDISEGEVKNLKQSKIITAPYVCKCKRSFRSKTALISHMKIHTSKKPYTCSVCDRSFILKFHLDTHMSIHMNKPGYQCKICKNSFFRRSDLNKHILIHTGK